MTVFTPTPNQPSDPSIVMTKAATDSPSDPDNNAYVMFSGQTPPYNGKPQKLKVLTTNEVLSEGTSFGTIPTIYSLMAAKFG